MARSFPVPCEQELKWVFKAGINIDSATLAKNLTILCTVAFSATVLYVMYSSSKRPHYTQYYQVSLSDDEDLSDDDHTTQCKTRCRHSIIGNSDRSRPPERLMSFGISLDDVRSSSSMRAYCPLGSGDKSPTVDAQIQTSTGSCPIDLIATNDVDRSAGTRQDGNSLNSCGIDNAETQTMPSFMGTVLNSGDFCGIDNAETQTMPKSVMASVQNSSSDITMAAGALSTAGRLFAQVQPFTVSTASGPDVTEAPCAGISPSTSTSTALGAKVFESLLTQTLPPTTTTASGPGVTAAGRLDDTCLCSGVTKDPECTRAQAVLRHSKGGESPVRSMDELNVMQCDSVEKEEEDGGSHFEGYIHGIIREQGSKSYKCRLYGGVSFAKERREPVDGGCSQGRIDLEEKDGVRFHEGCTQVEGGIELCEVISIGEKDGVTFHEACPQVEDGVEICKNISIGGPRKIVKGVREKECGHIVSSQEACGNTLSRNYRPSHCDSFTQTKAQDKGTCIPVGSFSASTSWEACKRRPFKQFLRKEETHHLVGNNFECRDNGTSKFVDTFSGSSTRGAGRGRLLRQLPTLAKEETRNLLGNNFEKCTDKGTSTSVNTFPSSRTRGACTGLPLKQTRPVPKEETCHSIENDFSFVEKRTEEGRDCGITNVQPEPVDPLEHTKSSLKTLTETQHWSKMSLPEQYECLGLLDSTLAAASEQLNGKVKGTLRTGDLKIQYLRRNLNQVNHLSANHVQEHNIYRQSNVSKLNLAKLRIVCILTTIIALWKIHQNPLGSPACPNVDQAHLHFQQDANCTNIPSSSSRQVEEFCADVTCAEAQPILQDKQVHRVLSSYPEENHQPSSQSTTCDSLSYRLPRSAQNLLDESNGRANISAETRRMQSEAARETRTRSKLLAKISKYHCM